MGKEFIFLSLHEMNFSAGLFDIAFDFEEEKKSVDLGDRKREFLGQIFPQA